MNRSLITANSHEHFRLHKSVMHDVIPENESSIQIQVKLQCIFQNTVGTNLSAKTQNMGELVGPLSSIKSSTTTETTFHSH